ncbi:MAG: DUF6891 domain-containing protein [Marmoricola sp.]
MSRRLGDAERLAQTRGWVRDLVRSGLLYPQALLREVSEALAVDHPGLPDGAAAEWIAAAQDDWRRDAAGWDERTDHVALQEVFGQLEEAGFLVLQGCADHWAATQALREAPDCAGVLWFTAPDVWHAIEAAMLEVNLWHPDTRNAALGDPLLDRVLAAFAAQGLAAHFDEGRIEVAARWQRRPV